ncbi:MAG: TrkH family potassium uptake protein [Christensenellales bacterium]|jgi:trk system potassium uptake protein TrkH
MAVVKGLRINSTQKLVLGYLAVIFIGAALLSLPVATRDGNSVGMINALFTSTSAVCVTGLVVVDTGTTYSLFGQIVILLLIQTGGLGFMTIASLAFLLVRKRITLSERLIIKESLNQDQTAGVVRLVRRVLLLTFILEGVGMILLSTRFIPFYGVEKGLYFSLFHAVSAFCNAGFDLIGNFQSIAPFRNDAVVNFTVMGLIVLGGLGFVVITDIWRKRSLKKLDLHSKAVLKMTAILVLAGAALFYIMESGNPATLGAADVNGGSRVMGAFFQSVTARTAGFNTVAQPSMALASKLGIMLLMFIGASPASTGGGIKTTTAYVVFKTAFAVMRGRDEVNMFGRRLARDVVMRSVGILTLAFVIVFGSSLVVLIAETGTDKPFQSIVFEVFSAFGTVGLSDGITPTLAPLSKLMIIITMFAGRLGPLTLTMAFARRLHSAAGKIRYPEDRLMVG